MAKRLIGYAGRDSRGESDDAPGKPERFPAYAERRRAILSRHNEGDSHVDIASDYGISRERVRQIVAAEGGTPRRGKQAPNAKRGF